MLNLYLGVTSALALSALALPGNLKPADFEAHLKNAPAEVRDTLDSRQSTLTPTHYTWQAASSTDSRAPCPMLNTLANHGFLPRTGRNINYATFTKGVKDALRTDQDLADFLFDLAMQANPDSSATTFDLPMLNKKGFIEHDGSTAFRDKALDSRDIFNKAVFDNFVSKLGSKTTLTIATASDAKVRHMFDMSKLNSQYTIKENQRFPIMAESAALQLVFGKNFDTVANRTFYEYFFRNFRLPVPIGWAPAGSREATVNDLFNTANAMVKAMPSDVPFLFENGKPT